MNRDRLGQNLVVFLVGAAVGAAVALLYAPQDGETTRKLIGEKATDVRDKAVEVGGNVSTAARDKWSVASDKIQGLIQRNQPDGVRAQIGSNGATQA